MNDSSLLKILHSDELTGQIAVLVGTRPGIIKMSPLIRTLSEDEAEFFVIHSGQHYSFDMDGQFFDELDLPRPKHQLEGMKAFKLHGEQTAEMLKGIERVLVEERPRILLVCGDANTNLAGAIAARKLHIQVGHVEAGLRSYDWRMPEEHNRVMIDHISDYLFAPSDIARSNLEREHVQGKIFVVGNTIVEAVNSHFGLTKDRSVILEQLGLMSGEFILATCHREENVDNRDTLRDVVHGLLRLPDEVGYPVVFPVHHRTRDRLERFDLLSALEKSKDVQLIPPVGYLDFLALMGNALVILTDSGGVQQESCILGVQCVTIRDNTEWVETIPLGANVLAGTDPDAIVDNTKRQITVPREWHSPFGDGTSARQIVEVVYGHNDDTPS